MEGDTLNWNSLKSAVFDYTTKLASVYKSYLKRDKKISSGRLYDSVKPLEPIVTDSGVQGRLNIEDYWKYVESGRKPGKFPPPESIRQFIRDKKIISQSSKKLPTENQLVFLISRSIANNGIKPGNQMQQALEHTSLTVIDDAVTQDLEKNFTFI